MFLRRRHQTLSSAVNKVDGFVKFSNVGGFVCHIANIIVLFYSIAFHRDSTANPISFFAYVSLLEANVVGLFFATSAGIIVNHAVRIVVGYFNL